MTTLILDRNTFIDEQLTTAIASIRCHFPEGINPSMVQRVRENLRRTPTKWLEDVDFAQELLVAHEVIDKTYRRAMESVPRDYGFDSRDPQAPALYAGYTVTKQANRPFTLRVQQIVDNRVSILIESNDSVQLIDVPMETARHLLAD